MRRDWGAVAGGLFMKMKIEAVHELDIDILLMKELANNS